MVVEVKPEERVAGLALDKEIAQLVGRSPTSPPRYSRDTRVALLLVETLQQQWREKWIHWEFSTDPASGKWNVSCRRAGLLLGMGIATPSYPWQNSTPATLALTICRVALQAQASMQRMGL